MDRRSFLKAGALLALFSTFKKFGFSLQGAEKKVKKSASGTPDIVALRGGTVQEMFDRGIRELGGMGSFVKKGQIVTIKPNIAWDKSPEMAANTNPDLVEHVVKECFKAGASKVYVFDTTCNFWKDTYKNSGIAAAASKAGAVVTGGDTASDPAYVREYYSDTPVPKGKTLKRAMVHKYVKECDVFINMPVLKVHGGAKLTCCMKNLMGIVTKEYHRYFHQNGLNQCIADCCTIRVPDLNIVDAYRVMTKRGPRGVDASDVKLLQYQMLGRDMVALDTAGARLLNVPVRRVGYLPPGEKNALGTTELRTLNIKRINCKS